MVLQPRPHSKRNLPEPHRGGRGPSRFSCTIASRSSQLGGSATQGASYSAARILPTLISPKRCERLKRTMVTTILGWWRMKQSGKQPWWLHCKVVQAQVEESICSLRASLLVVQRRSCGLPAVCPLRTCLVCCIMMILSIIVFAAVSPSWRGLLKASFGSVVRSGPTGMPPEPKLAETRPWHVGFACKVNCGGGVWQHLPSVIGRSRQSNPVAWRLLACCPRHTDPSMPSAHPPFVPRRRFAFASSRTWVSRSHFPCRHLHISETPRETISS